MDDEQKTYGEARLREEYATKIKAATIETLPALMEEILAKANGYGEICVATGLCAAAAAYACDKHENGGVTGFQASAIVWEFLRNWGALYPASKAGGRMLDYQDLLYPQYADRFTTISQKVWGAVQEMARENLAGKTNAHPDVIAHWEATAAGRVPFNLRIHE